MENYTNEELVAARNWVSTGAVTVKKSASEELALSKAFLAGNDWRKNLKSTGELPLNPSHICFSAGHNMFSLYALNNLDRGGSSYWGSHKCSRCGYVEDWQYDF